MNCVIFTFKINLKLIDFYVPINLTTYIGKFIKIFVEYSMPEGNLFVILRCRLIYHPNYGIGRNIGIGMKLVRISPYTKERTSL